MLKFYLSICHIWKQVTRRDKKNIRKYSHQIYTNVLWYVQYMLCLNISLHKYGETVNTNFQSRDQKGYPDIHICVGTKFSKGH